MCQPIRLTDLSIHLIFYHSQRINNNLVLSSFAYDKILEVQQDIRNMKHSLIQNDGSGVPLAAVITSTIREAMREELSLQLHSKAVGSRSQEVTTDQHDNNSEVIDPLTYRFRPAVAIRTNLVNSKFPTIRRWNLWLLFGTLSLYRQCQNTQEAYEATRKLARERFGVSFASSVSFLTGFTAHLVRDSSTPQIYISLTWRQYVPTLVLHDLAMGKGPNIKQELDSGRLSVNAYDEYGITLLHWVSASNYR